MNPNISTDSIFKNPFFIAFIIVAIFWSLIWKGIALWKAARDNDLVWYIILLIFNTVGILEIIYIFVFSKKEVEK